ncbi:MAG: hypothetical protein H0T89_28045 [Deltaproteobacteria bacterium]|nr:hypothetical protein [Deltaproteobacteria bacterium]MDQ3298688.1 hypothetical protein [Myxococcota bacterium]
MSTPPLSSLSAIALQPSRKAARRGAALAIAVFVPFLAFWFWVAIVDGPLGFLTLAGREPWGMQVLLDLMIALVFGLQWVRNDARVRGIAAWPYVPLTLVCGSFGLLAYAIRRAWAKPAFVSP